MKRILACLLVGTFSLYLAACSTPALRPETGALSGWRLQGRIAITYQTEVWNLSIDWLQQGKDAVIQLSGPLGRGVARLQGNDFGVTLEHADGRTRFARDAETLLLEETGVRLPLAGLRYWVRGEVEPGSAAQVRKDQDGRMLELEQRGWRVLYLRYMSGQTLPRKLTLTNSEVKVKLVVDRWQAIPAHE